MDQKIRELWEKRKVKIETPKNIYIVKLEIFEDEILDTQIYKGEKLISYSTIGKDCRGWYNLDGSYGVADHNELEDFGAVQVNKKFRKRNIGHAALSFGIGAAILDFNNDDLSDKFEVRVAGIQDREYFYQSFGFITSAKDVGTKDPQIIGRYYKTTVPKINILDKKKDKK